MHLRLSKFSVKNQLLHDHFAPNHVFFLMFYPIQLSQTSKFVAALSVSTKHNSSVSLAKMVQIHPPSAMRILLPDGRHMAYHEQRVPANKARSCLISIHNLSSRLAGIPGLNVTLLEEFGVGMATYDLPGFGESDPHPNRSRHSSAMDILHC